MLIQNHYFCLTAFMCFCFHVLFTSPTFTWSCSLTRKINSPDGKQDLSDSAAGIGTALVSTSTTQAITASNNNNNNISCDDTTTTPSSPVLGGDSSGNVVTGGESTGGGGDESGVKNKHAKWPVKPGVHLHVNASGLQSLGRSIKPCEVNGFSFGTKPSSSTLPLPSSNGKNMHVMLTSESNISFSYALTDFA